MSRQLFLDILDRGIENARICFEIDGSEVTVGRGDGEGEVTIRVAEERFFRRVLTEGNLGLGEAFMDGDFTVEKGSLERFLEILLRSRLDRKIKAKPGAAARILLMRTADHLRGKAHNVQRHYDLGDDLFESFLDSTLSYSCGYAKDPGDDIETLQDNKLHRICQKLRLAEGERLLDIGCGYGGVLIHAAKHYGARGVGVTLSKNHCRSGQAAAAAAGVADRVEIRFADFNDVTGEFDKVVSVGMMEHVPRGEYRPYFSKIAEVLTPGGLGLVHTVGANSATNEHDPFTQKYIFPNSNQPRLSEIATGLEKHGLAILDVENMIRHYAYTATRWLENFRANRGRLDASRYDQAFQRMWEYYLACCVAAGYASDSALYQVLFTSDYAAPLPLQRV